MRYLLAILVVVTCQNSYSDYVRLTPNNAQIVFTKSFCGNCSDHICSKNSIIIQNQLDLVISPTSLEYNLNQKYGEIQLFSFTSFARYYYSKSSLDRSIKLAEFWVKPTKTQDMKGVILYFHSSIFNKVKGAPSSMSEDYLAIAAFYVSQGYGVIFPDYPGEGIDKNFPHPYLLSPRLNVKAGVEALYALTNDLRLAYYRILGTIPLYVTGYSEGSNYALWFSKCWSDLNRKECWDVITYDNQKVLQYYSFKGSASIEGAYDLENVVIPFLIENVNKTPNIYQIQYQAITNIAKPGLAVLMLDSYFYYGLLDGLSLKAQLLPEFFSMNCEAQNQCNIENKHKDLIGALKSEIAESDTIAEAIGQSAFNKSFIQFNTNYSYSGLNGKNNTIFALVHIDVINSSILKKEYQGASIMSYAPLVQTPHFLFSLQENSIVSVKNTKNFYQNVKGNVNVSAPYYFPNKNHSVCITEYDQEYVDHLQSEILGVMFSSNFFKSIAFHGAELDSFSDKTTLSCLKTKNHSFIVVKSFNQSGVVNQNARLTLENARDLNLSADISFSLCRGKNSSKQAEDFLNAIPVKLYNNIWINLEINSEPGCSWSGYSPAENCAFMKDFLWSFSLSELEKGAKIGIFTTELQWKSIMGNLDRCELALHLPLYYANYDNQDSFKDFIPFANWVNPFMKQYTSKVMECGIPIRKSWKN